MYIHICICIHIYIYIYTHVISYPLRLAGRPVGRPKLTANLRTSIISEFRDAVFEDVVFDNIRLYQTNDYGLWISESLTQGVEFSCQ